MDVQDQYDLIEQEIQPYLIGERTKAAALLAWFMEAVWRIEPEDIDDSICDGYGDKGIDGLLVSDDLNELTVLQSKYREKAGAGQGDADLTRLVGAGQYFQSVETVDGLLAAKPNLELRQLIERLDIRERVAQGAEAKQLIFVTNGILDPAGRDYVAAMEGQEPTLEVWDLPRLVAIAIRTKSPDLLPEKLSLTATAPPTHITLGDDVEMAIGIIPAVDLVKLPGIDDLSLFDRNVRLSEGRSRINRELGETISKPAEHPLFPAYHNGLTVLTHELKVSGDVIELDGITVVNGCQSLLSLHQHQMDITDDLSLLVKIIQVERQSDLADKITYRSNNQNPVDIRDQRSTDVIQRDLQQQVTQEYGSKLGYLIRKGESIEADAVIDNKTAAQFLMAIYLNEPWNAVRKVRLFDHDYRRIFSRRIDAHKIYFANLVREVVDSVRDKLRADLRGSFASVRVTLAYLLAEVLRLTEKGTELIERPERWLPDVTDEVKASLTVLAGDVVENVNYHIEQQRETEGEEFDPKVVFKSQKGVSAAQHDITRDAKAVARKDSDYLFQIDPVR